MKNICQKLAVAAASVAIGLTALKTLPANAVTFVLGDPNSPLHATRTRNIRFSGTPTFRSITEAEISFENLDSFKATLYELISPDSYTDVTWDKTELLSFSFRYNPLTIDYSISGLYGRRTTHISFKAIDSTGAILNLEPRGILSLMYLPRECPPSVPPWVTDCGYYENFMMGTADFYRVADDPTSQPVPEGTVIPGLVLGIGWLIQKRKRLSPLPETANISRDRH